MLVATSLPRRRDTLVAATVATAGGWLVSGTEPPGLGALARAGGLEADLHALLWALGIGLAAMVVAQWSATPDCRRDPAWPALALLGPALALPAPPALLLPIAIALACLSPRAAGARALLLAALVLGIFGLALIATICALAGTALLAKRLLARRAANDDDPPLWPRVPGPIGESGPTVLG